MSSNPETEEFCSKCGDRVMRVCAGCELPEPECDCVEAAVEEEE